jgi:hypothetical protein
MRINEIIYIYYCAVLTVISRGMGLFCQLLSAELVSFKIFVSTLPGESRAPGFFLPFVALHLKKS